MRKPCLWLCLSVSGCVWALFSVVSKHLVRPAPHAVPASPVENQQSEKPAQQSRRAQSKRYQSRTTSPRRLDGHNADHPSTGNFCGSLNSIINHTLDLEDSLQGSHLSVGSYLFPPFLEIDEATDDFAGWEVDLLTTLSKRAGFTFTIYEMEWQWNASWSEQLHKQLERFDLITFGYWTITSDRLENMADSPYGFLDLSSVFVSNEVRGGSTITIWQWTTLFSCFDPFGVDVWATLVVLWFWTGLLYMCFEVHSNHEDLSGSSLCANGTHSLYLALLQVTGAGGFTPVTWHGRILLASWAWYILLFIATYTANLASFLVVQSTADADISSLTSAMAAGMRLCTWPTSPSGEWFSQHYEYSNTYEVLDDGTATISYLNAGYCDGAIMNSFSWSQDQNSLELNSDCATTLRGSNLNSRSGGWMVKVDWFEKCSVVVKEGLRVHFVKMAEDGTLDTATTELQEAFWTRPGSVPCGETAISEVTSETTSLHFEDMSGPTLIHLFLSLSSFTIKIFHMLMRRFRRPKPLQRLEGVSTDAHLPREVLQDLVSQVTTLQQSLVKLARCQERWSSIGDSESPAVWGLGVDILPDDTVSIESDVVCPNTLENHVEWPRT